MKKRVIATFLVGIMATTIFTGCGSDNSDGAKTQSTTEASDLKSDKAGSGEVDMEAYEQLQADYEELLDYTIFLEQELVRAKGKYAETGAMMDEFTKANEAGNKIILVEPTTIEDAEKSIEEKSE